MPDVREPTGTEIIGHRGASGHGPENTEAALLAGLRLGATAIEVDVQFTADGVPVVFHDRSLERMAGVRGRIRDQTARELSGYDVGFRHGDDHRGARILTLDEAAALVPANVGLHVEIKDYDSVSSHHLKELIASLRRRGGLDRCIASSFSEKVLTALRTAEGRIRRGLLVSVAGPDSAKTAADLGCESLHPNADVTDRRLVDECHESGLRVYPYTVNDPGRMRHLIALGVDGLYTDFPARLAEIMGTTSARAHRPQPKTQERGRGASRDAATGFAAWQRSDRRGPAHQKPAARLPAMGHTEEEERPPAVETWDVTPERVSQDPIDAGSAIVTEAPEPAPVPADGEGRKKRRRGKRGGRRHRRGTSTTPEETARAESAPGEAETPIILAAAPDEPDTEPEEGETPGVEDEPDDEQKAEPAESEAAASEQPARRKRRRGRRGGRRHRERRLRKERAAGGESGEPEPPGAAPPDEAE
jgi:glycerophosphoryl diester phosphodiesterase